MPAKIISLKDARQQKPGAKQDDKKSGKEVTNVKGLSTTERLAYLETIAAKCNSNLKAEGKVYLGSKHKKRERIRSKILAFDIITGGGIVRGGCTEIYGQESSGKTLIVLQLVRATIEEGGIVVWLIGEGFDKPWAVRNGVDMSKVVCIEAMNGDTGCETAMTLLSTGAIDLLIFDSVQSLATTREMDAGVDSEAFAGSGQGQMWGRVMRKAYAFANCGLSDGTAIVLISQVREEVGGATGKYKPAPKPTGIRAIRHWKDISVQTRAGDVEFLYEDNDELKQPLFRNFHLLCAKNKTAIPLRTGSYRFYYQKDGDTPFGVDYVEQILRYAVAHKLIEARGGGQYEGGGLKARGRENFLALLRKDEALQEKLYEQILEINNPSETVSEAKTTGARKLPAEGKIPEARKGCRRKNDAGKRKPMVQEGRC